MGAAFFLVAAALVAGAEGAVLLVIRPDLVFPRTTGALSSTAGAGALFLTLETLALVLVALAGAAAFLVAAALGAALVAAFLGAAAFLAGASFAAAVVFLALAAVFGAALVALVSVFLAAGGEPAFAFAIFTGPEAPLGRSKTPVSLPLARARLNWVVKAASVTLERLLFAWTYFLRA